MPRFAGALLVALALSSCADPYGICDKAEKCASAAGSTFDRQACESGQDMLDAAAESKGCASLLSAWRECTLEFDCDASQQELNASCGAKSEELMACMQ